LWYGPFQIAFVLCLTWLWLVGQHQDSASKMPVALTSSMQAAIIPIVVVMLASLAYAAWDYHRVSQIYLPPEQRDAAYRSDTLDQVRESMLFADPARFAELTITELTPGNAERMRALAGRLLHYSPEPRVIEKLIEADLLLNHNEDAVFHLTRFRAAFPKDYAQWAADNVRLLQPLRPVTP
ncbi:MAG: Wzy polymerase domain-containing protein, partial [Rhodoferax sp.]